MKSKCYLLGILAVFPLFFISCNDGKMAKQLDGSWEGSSTVSYADGSKEKIQILYSFDYDDSRKDDDGTFIEMRHGKMNDSDPGFDGTLTYEYQSQIKGRWVVLLGDLCLYYNMNSLEVSVDPGDIKVKYDNEMDQLQYLSESIDYLFTTFRTPKEDYAKEAKKYVYRELFNEYSQYDRRTVEVSYL